MSQLEILHIFFLSLKEQSLGIKIKGVFIWRNASPLGRASPSKRAGFHLAYVYMGKASPPTWADSLIINTRVSLFSTDNFAILVKQTFLIASMHN